MLILFDLKYFGFLVLVDYDEDYEISCVKPTSSTVAYASAQPAEAHAFERITRKESRFRQRMQALKSVLGKKLADKIIDSA
uniref:Uncharacterized protein n=1 Tax=Trichogramma kaykai TaxID=54128 RepID=A0ABD2WN28_9HYME